MLSFQTKIYHPNVTNDDKGSMCLGILRSDQWKPSCKILAVLEMAKGLLIEPNPWVFRSCNLFVGVERGFADTWFGAWVGMTLWRLRLRNSSRMTRHRLRRRQRRGRSNMQSRKIPLRLTKRKGQNIILQVSFRGAREWGWAFWMICFISLPHFAARELPRLSLYPYPERHLRRSGVSG